MNNSLYEFLLPSEARPVQDNVVNHAVIKADVRGSTRITQDLLARGLNPATLFSLNFYEPVKRILDRYGAAKVFIEGDAMVLAIFETESNRSHQRAVPRLARWRGRFWLSPRPTTSGPDPRDLPRLELGVGIAFQGSAPTYWVDSDSRIMISRALNLSDRLSSCSKVARRLLGDKSSLFRLFVFQPGMEGAQEDEIDEFLIRFNLNGVELNEEGFAKLTEEIALTQVEVECEMPWGREPTTFFIGQAPIGEAWNPSCCGAVLCGSCSPTAASARRGSAPTTRSARTTGFWSASRPWLSRRRAKREIPEISGRPLPPLSPPEVSDIAPVFGGRNPAYSLRASC